MTFDPARHHRRSIRLKDYDYTQAGAYFVTLCAQGRECLFGEVVDGESQMNESGRIAAECWDDMARHFPTVELDASIIMPNHLHGIVIILPHTAVTDASVSKGVVTSQGEIVGKGAVTAPQRRKGAVTAPLLGQIIAYAKYQSTKRINILRGTPAVPVWQRNYYEHIIRNDADLQRIREYIVNNPLKWELDQLHPSNPSK